MSDSIVGVVIAGGKGLRMGGCEKVLLEIDNKTILNHIIDTASPQVERLLLNTNSDSENFSKFQLSIIKDIPNMAPSPLLGVYSTLDWLKKNDIGCDWLMSFPGDCPFFPEDIIPRLMNLLKSSPKAKVCSVVHNQQIQPLFSLWSSTITESLKKYIEAEKFSVQGFIKSLPHAALELSHDNFNRSHSENKASNWENFFININTPDELEKVQR